MINIIISGANGKMGRVTVNAINAEQDFKLVATTGRDDNLEKVIAEHKADVVIDFTTPEAVFKNTNSIINANARPVIGTTGLTPDQIDSLKKRCAEQKLGAIIAPNFSLASILMMRFAQQAAHYIPNVEIIEMHHNQKHDAPSGTAIKTAQLIEKSRQEKPHIATPNLKSRGEICNEVPIHSVRLPGFFAHQAVIFGSTGETLTLRVDAIDRNAMMPGVVTACRKVMEIDHLIYGLETILS